MSKARRTTYVGGSRIKAKCVVPGSLAPKALRFE